MKRFVATVMAAAGLLVVVAAPVAGEAGDSGVTVAVMKHACNPDVRNLDDFNAIVESAESPVAALAATVLACPAVVNPGDESSDGVKADPASFSFTVEDAEQVHDQPADSIAAKLCEADLDLDADGDGNIVDTTCLDISHYAFEGIANGEVTVTETESPPSSEFGTLLFTPTEVDSNNDADSLVSLDRAAGVIKLDTSADEDGMIMLHVYNFEKQMPDTATLTESTTDDAPIAIVLLLGAGLATALSVWLVHGMRRRDAAALD
ncbi:MAG: hypothetical protein M3N29_09485 [Chloroflexota bacterium]|nr:hypothetical protein [Chloroflexota bacterium]